MRKFIIFFVLVFASFSYGATYTAYNKGDLLDAVQNLVQDGDTIKLMPNNDANAWYIDKYYFLMTIDKDITIEGGGDDPSDVKITTYGIILSNYTIFHVTANNVTFKNFTIDTGIKPIELHGNGNYTFKHMDITTYNSNDAIKSTTDNYPQSIVVSCSNIKSKNGTQGGGIYISKAKSVIVSNSIVSGKISGVYVKKAEKVDMINSSFYTDAGGSYPRDPVGEGVGNAIFTSAIRVNFADKLNIIGATIGATQDAGATGASAIYIGSGIKDALISKSCITGGWQNVNVNTTSTINIEAKNNTFDESKKGAFRYSGTSLSAHANCFYANNPMTYDISSQVSASNDISGNYWKDKGAQNMYGNNYLDSCPSENNCKYTYEFDAWDVFRDDKDRNISTKIVKNNFKLGIHVLDEVAGFYGTVSAKIVSQKNKDKNISSVKQWKVNGETNKDLTFNVTSADKNASVYLSWKEDASCNNKKTDNNDDVFSTDNFAIRPKQFDIELPITIGEAGEDFTVNFLSLYDNKTTSTTKEYDELENSTFQVTWNERGDNELCYGTSSEPIIKFKDGYESASYINAKSGKYDVTIKEKDLCKDRFSAVDCKDSKILGTFPASGFDPEKDTIITKYTSDKFNLKCSASAFDAMDTFRTFPNTQISSKLTTDKFKLKLIPLAADGKTAIPYRGTVCARVVKGVGSIVPISSWAKVVFKNKSSAEATFENNKVKNENGSNKSNMFQASKDNKIQIAWYDDDITQDCPLVQETNSTYSSDHFAIKPAGFEIMQIGGSSNGEVNGKSYYCGNGTSSVFTDVEFRFIAKDRPTGYNETVGKSFIVTYQDKKDTGKNDTKCITGTFTPSIKSGWSFKDGYQDFKSYYSEVGDVDINITDIPLACGDKFASIDCKDENVTNYWNTSEVGAKGISIGRDDTNATFVSHGYNVSTSLKNFNNGNFTYLANEVKDMYAMFDMNISTNSNMCGVLKNYTSQCYAHGVEVRLKTNTEPKIDKSVTAIRTYEEISDITSNEINATPTAVWTDMALSFPNTIFDQGVARVKMHINFSRSDTAPVNPFKFTVVLGYLLELNASSMSSSGYISKTPGDATFYYGRVRIPDVQTVQTEDISDRAIYEVYDKSASVYTKDIFLRNSFNWYKNKWHTGAIYGDVNNSMIDTDFTGVIKSDSKENKLKNIVLNGYTSGNQNFTFDLNSPDNPDQLTVHVKTKPWLWYGTSSALKAYSDIGDCLEHPCFEVDYSAGTGVLESGKFKGSDVNITKSHEANASVKRGVKFFR